MAGARRLRRSKEQLSLFDEAPPDDADGPQVEGVERDEPVRPDGLRVHPPVPPDGVRADPGPGSLLHRDGGGDAASDQPSARRDRRSPASRRGRRAVPAAQLPGIAAGLVVGKPLGMLVAAWITTRAGATALPPGATSSAWASSPASASRWRCSSPVWRSRRGQRTVRPSQDRDLRRVAGRRGRRCGAAADDGHRGRRRR